MSSLFNFQLIKLNDMKKIDFLLGLLFVGTIGIANGQTYNATTYAGGGGSGAATTGPIATTKFYSPERLTFDNDGNIIVVDRSNALIRKIDVATGMISTIAGSGVAGYTDANGVLAQFKNPWGATVDASGNIFVADAGNFVIRKIATDGTVTTYAGNGTSAVTNNDNPLLASFKQPLDVIFDKNNNLLVADGNSNLIRAIAPDGKVTTYAGDGTSAGNSLNIDNDNPLLAIFDDPSGLGKDKNGNIYVADRFSARIRKIDVDKKVTTVAGSGTVGNTDNTDPLSATFTNPYDVDVDASGNIFVVELSHDVRKIAANGTVTTIAGLPGSSGDVDGVGSIARFYNPSGVLVAPNGVVYVVEVSNQKIKALIPSTLPVNLAYFTGKMNDANGVSLTWSTASEQNNDYFDLLRSSDGVTWSSIKTIKGKGNSNEKAFYSHIDTSPLAGINYYVLKQVDFDGTSTFSDIVDINFKLGVTKKLTGFYENNILVISAESPENDTGRLIVHNLNGQTLASQNINLIAGVNEFTVPVSLQDGLYILSLVSSKENQTIKFGVKN